MIKILFCSIALLLTFNFIQAQETEGTCAPFEIGPVIIPVLTPFKTNGDVNFDEIEPYAQYLKDNGICDILVLGYSGESSSMDLCERIEVIRKWVEVAGPRGIGITVEIQGGIPFKDSLILAQLCVELKVKAIAIFPTQFYEPRTVEEFIVDIEAIAKVAVGLPIIIEEILAVNSSVSFVDLFIAASARIPCFVGCTTTLNTALNIRAVTSTYYDKYLLISGYVSIGPALQLNLNSTIVSLTSVFPLLVCEIVAAVQARDFQLADMKQTELNVKVAACLGLTGDADEAAATRSYLEKTKICLELKSGLKIGIPRPPLVKRGLEEVEQIANALIEVNVELASNAASVVENVE